MAQILLEVNNHKAFVKNDMLIFDGKTFISVKKEHILRDIPKLYGKIDSLEKEIKILKATIEYDHGKISEEEFKELCGGNK